MYNQTIILKSRPAGLLARAGRSLCRRRPVSMPASAGLYAGIYAGMGPRGLGPNPFSTVSQISFFLFRDFGRPQKSNVFLWKIGVCFLMFAILANVDINLRLKICEIAI